MKTRIILITLALLLMWFVYSKFIKSLLERSRLIKQGVVYLDKPMLSEISTFESASKAHPYDPVLNGISTKIASL